MEDIRILALPSKLRGQDKGGSVFCNGVYSNTLGFTEENNSFYPF